MLEDEALAMLRSLHRGWHDLFNRVAGVDLSNANLKDTLLARGRQIDRHGVPGFADFAPQSEQAICAGDPALSLVYHALASPRVHPTPDGSPADPSRYPDLRALDLLENWIWSLAPVAVPQDAIVATFAYEYRTGAYTSHRRHADFVYSRTGVARIGDRPRAWDGPNRCWLSTEGTGFRTMPARYAAFLAVPRRRSPNTVSVVGDMQDGDAGRTFLLPVTKLWSGAQHVGAGAVQVAFREFHRAEKLRRIFVETGTPPPAGLAVPPYLRDSTNTPGLVSTEALAGSVLVGAPAAPLVRLAKHPDGSTATFTVPPQQSVPVFDFALNRHFSSFMIITGLLAAGVEGAADLLRLDPRIRPRNAPEFVNIRHRVEHRADGELVTDLNALPSRQFADTLKDGGYEAALFEDSSCDGAVLADVTGLALPPARPAFSIIAVPDFFPYAGQIDIEQWVEQFPSHNRSDQFKEGGPAPLSDGRLAVNPTMLRPGAASQAAFDRHDTTMVALVGRPYGQAAGPTNAERIALHTTSCLTDACSNEFAPGWDISFAQDAGGKYYATFGLGSPFLEDVKLCAAANAYWPAASPDAGRTFHRSPTAIPMLDGELGYHPRHPDCPAEAKPAGGTRGWDGEQGPFLEQVADGAGNQRLVANYADIMRSDYVSNAFNGHISGQALARVDSDELIGRMDCLRLAIQTVGSGRVGDTPLWLVYAAPIADWSAVPLAGAPALTGKGYRYEFVSPQGAAFPSDDMWRLLQPYGDHIVCHVTADAIRWSVNGGAFRFARG
jgi:hypothetical protein